MFVLFPLLNLFACSDVEDPHGHGNAEEVITTVAIFFTPASGADKLSYTWTDPLNDGNPAIDTVVLTANETYAVSVSFLNALEEPTEDITPEIEDEGDQHQVFFTGSAVEGPATGENPNALIQHTYDDTDANGYPVGLLNIFETLMVGAGELTITLRHMPEENGQPVKTEGAAEAVAADGFGAIGGDNDAQVTFEVQVN